MANHQGALNANWSGKIFFSRTVFIVLRRGRHRCGETRATRRCEVIQVAQFLQDQDGATAIEYGLIAAGIAVAIIAAVQGLGSKLTSTFTSVQSALQ
jgi:pilus assembly protein Flp/PilA